MPQAVPYSIDCPDKIFKGGVVEYYKIVKTQIDFVKDPLT